MPEERGLARLAVIACRALLAAVLLHLVTGTSAEPGGFRVVSNGSELYRAFGASDVSTIYLTQTLVTDGVEWKFPLSISRNVTIAAHPTWQAVKIHITLDLANLAARVFLQPDTQLTFRWLELVNYVEELGPAMLLLGPSPTARVLFDRCVLRRRAGFQGLRNLADVQALSRPAAEPGSQVAFFLPRFCYNVSRQAAQQCALELVYVVQLVADLGPAQSSFFAAGVPLGQYVMQLEESAQTVDNVINADCVRTLSESACVQQLLKLLDIAPVIIRTKASDSNLVKIVASLAILAVSVLLFLYFRRHYRTYQQRRARRMRRMKDALGMGPEAHGIMFNGLDGEEADWQIMPMPVGYAAEESAMEPQMHQDSNIRNLIKDISNRPNRHIPDYVEGEEIRIDVDCPIAHEVGLRRSHDVGTHGGRGEGGTEAMNGGRERNGDNGTGGTGGGGGRASLSGEGGQGVQSCSGTGAPGSNGAAGGAHTRGSLGSHVGSHQSASDSRGARAPHGMVIGLDSVALTLPPGQGSGGGGGISSPRYGAPALALTAAGMEALLASRVAAGGVVTSGSGGTGRMHASGSESGGAVAAPAAAGPTDGHESAAGGAADATASPRAGAGVTVPMVVGANRLATQFAVVDVDVASRVIKSKDSDSEGREVANNPQVSDLMDELEELRRDIMSGINDTQLQIMSVVGSGAFGTVYRGQWQGLEVAVKTVVFSASSENRKRALQEAALCQSINHRNIVATYAVDVQPLGAVNTPVLNHPNARNSTLSNLLDWRLYIVQEYCDGGPLRKIVQSQYLTANGPNMPVICELALELAQALAHLHSKNVIHGDLNPNNVLLKRDATSPMGFRVKMADFGLSVMVPIQKTHMSNLRLGTLYYIAPETCFRGQLGYAADVFSLGVMLWELYHGRLAGTRTPTGEPRYQPDFPDFPPACPVDFRKLAHRCLQKQPHNRLHSSQVVQRLQEMLAAYRATGTPVPVLPPLPLGGPDENGVTAVAMAAAEHAGPMFANDVRTAGGTPADSRHRPNTPNAGAAAAATAAAASLEISPHAGTDSPKPPTRR